MSHVRHVSLTISEVETLWWDGSVNYFCYYRSLLYAKIVVFQLINNYICAV